MSFIAIKSVLFQYFDYNNSKRSVTVRDKYSITVIGKEKFIKNRKKKFSQQNIRRQQQAPYASGQASCEYHA